MSKQRTETSLNEIVIESRSSNIFRNLLGIWKYRHLLSYLAFRITRQRYKETVLGWLWLVIRPLVSGLLFTIIFGEITKVPSDGVPYFLFILAGMSLWNFFSNSLVFVTRSLQLNRRLITKLYFPRILVPLASVMPFVIEFFITILLVIGIAIFYYFKEDKFYICLRPELAFSLLFITLTFIFLLGISFWTSVLNSQARDVRFTLPYIMQMWFYITPVIYPLSHVPEKWQWLVNINPMTTIIEGFKWSILGVGELNIDYVIISSGIIFLAFLSGIWFFSKAETKFVDNL